MLSLRPQNALCLELFPVLGTIKGNFMRTMVCALGIRDSFPQNCFLWNIHNTLNGKARITKHSPLKMFMCTIHYPQLKCYLNSSCQYRTQYHLFSNPAHYVPSRSYCNCNVPVGQRWLSLCLVGLPWAAGFWYSIPVIFKPLSSLFHIVMAQFTGCISIILRVWGLFNLLYFNFWKGIKEICETWRYCPAQWTARQEWKWHFKWIKPINFF